MKIIVTLILIQICIYSMAFAQYGDLNVTDTINFESDNNSFIKIDTSQNGSIWKIGVPSKSYFDSAYTEPNAIFTDTSDSYPNNSFSYFDLIIKDTLPFNFFRWGEGIIGFWHKYDTDSLTDGGYIEVSYNGGNSWVNIIHDTLNLEISSVNFYTNSDTITGNIPAFSGHSNGWIYSQFYWFWICLTKDIPADS
jgi:hypothetical protein